MGKGHFTTADGHTMVYSGGEIQGQRGVALWIHKKIKDTLLEYKPINDRILVVRINAKPRKLRIVQIYAPTSVATEEEIDKFYEELDATYKKIPKHDKQA